MHSSDGKVTRNTFPSLNLDIISHNDITKQYLDFIKPLHPSKTEAPVLLVLVVGMARGFACTYSKIQMLNRQRSVAALI
jgi:hypothetical protein